MILFNFWPKKQITNSYGNLFSRSNENLSNSVRKRRHTEKRLEQDTIAIRISRRTEVMLEDNTQYVFCPTVQC